MGAGRWQRAVRGRRARRVAAAGLAGLAVPLAIDAVHSDPARGVEVPVAAADLPAGRPLTWHDVRTERLPAGSVPAGALRPGDAVDGLVPAIPIRAGEPLTDVRFLGPGLLGRYAGAAGGTLAVPVRFADAGAVRLLRPGDRVDVFAAPVDEPVDNSVDGAVDRTGNAGSADPGRPIASDVGVLTIPDSGGAPPDTPDVDGPAAGGGLVVLAADAGTAARLAARAGARLSFAVLP